MKKIDDKSVQFLIYLIVLVSVFGLIIYPLSDFLIDRFISHTEFIYSLRDHVIDPIVFALIFSITYWVINRKKK